MNVKPGDRVSWSHERMHGGTITLSTRRGTVLAIDHANGKAAIRQSHNNGTERIHLHRLRKI